MPFPGTEAIIAGILTMGLCLSIHSFFMFTVLKSQLWFRSRVPKARGAALIVPSVLLATTLMAISSMIQIGIWSGLLWSSGHFENVHDALYFSGTTYTTLGTGKHVLTTPYRIFEPLEATNGMLAAGLNTAILFAILSNVGRRQSSFDEFFK